MPRRLTPIRRLGAPRFIDRGGFSSGTGASATAWASCQKHEASPFKADIHVNRRGGAYVSNSDLAMLGLLVAPLAYAWTGPSWAFFKVADGVILASSNIARGLLAGPVAGVLGGLIPPRAATYTNFSPPCTENVEF